jgi:formamidopyrimidine-DNA glycosylase
MPELPDVEVMRRYLARHGLNRRIKAVVMKDQRIQD